MNNMEIINNIDHNRPLLHITWHYTEFDVERPMVHHASLALPYRAAALFTPEYAKVELAYCKAIFNKNGKIIGYKDYIDTLHLPCKQSDSAMIIPLNDQNLLDHLTLNSWRQRTSKRKKGNRTILEPKEFPAKLTVTLEGKRHELTFDANFGQTPALICETQLDAWLDKIWDIWPDTDCEDKIDFIIALD